MVNTHGLTIKTSKRFAGQLFTRIPISYLRWMVQTDHPEADIAKAEIDRRGSTVPGVNISGHAIDSASKRLLGLWTSTRRGEEGLHSWLCRLATEAYHSCTTDKDGSIVYNGVRFVFSTGEYPVLKTVM